MTFVETHEGTFIAGGWGNVSKPYVGDENEKHQQQVQLLEMYSHRKISVQEDRRKTLPIEIKKQML